MGKMNVFHPVSCENVVWRRGRKASEEGLGEGWVVFHSDGVPAGGQGRSQGEGQQTLTPERMRGNAQEAGG